MVRLRTSLLPPSTRNITRIVMLMLFFVVMSALVPATSKDVHATGAVGGAGGAGGGSGGAQTRNGWGWYNFSVTGSPKRPQGFRNGSSWSSVSNICKGVGADRVIAFIVLTEFGNDANKGVVYDYKSSWDSFSNHRSGGDWLSTPYAKGLYDSIKASDKLGYTWGSNVAWFCYSPTPTKWTISTSSTADKTTAKPGDAIKWTHTVKNDGPAKTNKYVTYHYQNRDGLGGGSGPDGTLTSGGASGATKIFNSTYTVTGGDLGKTLCRATSASPKAWNNAGWIESISACVNILYDYSLKPHTSVNPNDVVEPPSSIEVTPSIENIGKTKSKDTEWEVTRIVVDPGEVVPNKAGGTSSASPCGLYFSAGGSKCSNISKGKSVFKISGDVLSGDKINMNKDNIGDLPIGSQVCYAFSVKPYDQSNNVWRHSAPVCVVVGKKPKVQVWGGDLIAGRAIIGMTGSVAKANIQTSMSIKNISGKSIYFGSWVEYGAQASGVITGLGSGAAYAGSSGLKNATNCKVNPLTFANAINNICNDSVSFGGYVNSQAIADVAASFQVTSSTKKLGSSPSINLSNSSYKSIQTATGDINITGGTVKAGRWFVLNAPKANVTISGNIKYTSGKISSIYDIPQVVIIAKNINIKGNVTNVDAWLIAKGSTVSTNGEINTCSDVYKTAPLSGSICNKKLVVNGPVMASKLYLRRTAGAGSNGSKDGDPAEVFNLRPDAYMWAYIRSIGSSRAQTVYSTELPPRL